MKRLYCLGTFLALLLYVTPTFALISGSSYTDALGYTHYSFSDGTSGTSRKDALGNTQFDLGNGTTGRAYTDALGRTHYSFDTNNTTNKQNQGTQSRCSIDFSLFTCLEESQYQRIHEQAESALPKMGYQRTPEQESMMKILMPNADFDTAEGREKVIMAGEYGGQLTSCRNSIDSYKTTKEYYDQCVQEETAKWQEYAQAKLDLMTQQDGNRLQKQKDSLCIQSGGTGFDPATKQCSCADNYTFIPTLSKCIADCPLNSTKSQTGSCLCNSGFVSNKLKTQCVKCEDEWPNSRMDNQGNEARCVCADGYLLDAGTNSCKKNVPASHEASFTPQTPKVDTEKILEIQKSESAKKIPSKTVEISSSIKDIRRQTSTLRDTAVTSETTDTVEQITTLPDQNNIEQKTEAKKIGIFQLVGERADNAAQNISSFFKKIFNRIKFW